MHLEHHYYELNSMHISGTGGLFYVALLPDCEVYRGHFPGNPVSPGVCNMQVIKECAERIIGERLYIRSIRRCRLLAVVTPAACPELAIRIGLARTEGGYEITATLSDSKRTYMELKGELTA